MQKKISIIICGYNAEEYIDRCMRSVENQTIGMKNLEVVLVDDASTDGTLEKFKQWEKKYPEDIIVITYEKNKRLGGARNIGLQYSTGEYIGYVDCDDWIEPAMYEKMYEKAVKFQCDVVRCKYSRDVEENIQGEKVQKGQDQWYDCTDFADSYLFWQQDMDVGVNGLYGSCWSGIYKKSVLTENNVYFPENLYYEDNFWSQLLALYITKLYIVDEVLYHYYVNDDSITMRRNDIRHLERLQVELLLLEELKSRGIYEKYYDIVERNFIITFYLNTMHIIFTRFDSMPDIFPQMKEIILKEFPGYKENPYYQEYLTATGKVLMKLLDSSHTWNCDELNEFRKKYVEIMNGKNV